MISPEYPEQPLKLGCPETQRKVIFLPKMTEFSIKKARLYTTLLSPFLAGRLRDERDQLLKYHRRKDYLAVNISNQAIFN